MARRGRTGPYRDGTGPLILYRAAAATTGEGGSTGHGNDADGCRRCRGRPDHDQCVCVSYVRGAPVYVRAIANPVGGRSDDGVLSLYGVWYAVVRCGVTRAAAAEAAVPAAAEATSTAETDFRDARTHHPLYINGWSVVGQRYW